MSDNWIAIDLGTTNSCASVWKDGRVEVIPISHGKRILASAVRFEVETRSTGKTMTIGDIAKEKRFKYYNQTVTDAKRVIGRTAYDPEVTGEIEVQSCLTRIDGKPVYVIDPSQQRAPTPAVGGRPPARRSSSPAGIQRYTPEDIGSFVIGELKQAAEKYLAHPVKDAVITCPAYFNDSQRRATREAGKKAGLNVLRIINEPTAAALGWSYQDREKKSVRSVHLIFDCGGGTTDVSIIDVNHGAHKVVASVGDMHCGGNDLDEALAKWLLNELKTKYKTNWIGRKDKWPEVIAACEKAKVDLSKEEEVDITLREVSEDITLQREDFLDICRPVFNRIFAPINKALEHARMSASNIDSVILVGGTSYIPAIKEGLKSRLPSAKIEETVDKDLAVSFGAGVQAALIKGVVSPAEISLSDIAPHTLSWEDKEGNSVVVIKEGEKLPAKGTSIGLTANDNQIAMTIKVYEGDDPLAKNNHRLGELTLSNIPKLPKGQVSAEITYEVDYDGILVVTAVMIAPSRGTPVTVTLQTG